MTILTLNFFYFVLQGTVVVNKQEVEINKITVRPIGGMMIGLRGTMEAAGWAALGLAAATGSMKIIIVWILHLKRSVFILTNPYHMDAIITRCFYILYLCRFYCRM